MRLSYASPSDLLNDVEGSMTRITKGIETILSQSQPNFENTIAELSRLLAREQTTATFLQNVSPEKEIREASRKASERMSDFQTDILSRLDLYRRIQSIDVSSDVTQKRLQEIILRDFEETGVSNPEASALLKEINKLSVEFERNVAEDTTTLTFTKADLVGMPEDFLLRTQQLPSPSPADPHPVERYSITLSYPNVFSILENCSVKETHILVKKTFESICPMNDALLSEMIQKRNQFAKLLHYDSWVDYATGPVMAKKSSAVQTMLSTLLETLKKPACTYLQKLQAVSPTPLERGDVPYYTNQYLKKNYEIDTNVVRRYFPLPHVFSTMLDIYGSLLGLTFQRTVPPADIWHSSVECLDVFDTDTSVKMGNSITISFQEKANIPMLPASLCRRDTTTIVGCRFFRLWR